MPPSGRRPACSALVGANVDTVVRYSSADLGVSSADSETAAAHTILAMLAYAFLGVLTATERAPPACTRGSDPADLQRDPPPVQTPSSPGRSTASPTDSAGQPWRRRHQHHTKLSHYRNRHKHEDHDLRLSSTVVGFPALPSLLFRSAECAVRISWRVGRMRPAGAMVLQPARSVRGRRSR